MGSWWTDGNVAILGKSQQGKSVLANQRHAEHPRVGVFFAPDREPWMVGREVQTPTALAQGIEAGGRKFVYTMPPFDLDLAERLDTLVRWMLVLGERGESPGFVLTVDEAHEVAPEGRGGTPLHLAAKRGKKRGVQVQMLTQDPAQLSLSALRQADWLAWVGPAGTSSVQYLDGKGLPAAAFAGNANHEYTVVPDRPRASPVDSGFADNSRYGDGSG